MVKRIYDKINRISNIRTLTALLSLAVLIMVVVNIFNFPTTVPRIEQLSNGTGLLDTKLYYTHIEAYNTLDALTLAGRQEYLDFFFTFDLVFPFIYSLALSVVITVVFQQIFLSKSWLQKLSLLPFFAGMFDYLENMAIITMLIKYPEHIDYLAFISGYFTLGKWVFSCLSLLLILFGIIRLLWIKGRLLHRSQSL